MIDDVLLQQILAQVGAVVEQKAPRQPRFVQPLHNAEIMDGHPYVRVVHSNTIHCVSEKRHSSSTL